MKINYLFWIKNFNQNEGSPNFILKLFAQGNISECIEEKCVNGQENIKWEIVQKRQTNMVEIKRDVKFLLHCKEKKCKTNFY